MALSESARDELRGILSDLNREHERYQAEMAALARRLRFLIGDVKCNTKLVPFTSPTGRKSKCVELSKQRKKQQEAHK